jgi:hypothetical protein
MKGDPIWSEKELALCHEFHPNYKGLMKALGGRRSYSAVRAKCQQLGLAPKRQLWSSASIQKLKRLYSHATWHEILAALPEFKKSQIIHQARYCGLKRPRKPFKATRHIAINAIRERAFDIGYTMPDVDALAKSKTYFQKASWSQGYINHRAIGRAIEALDGMINAKWNE